MTRPRAAAAVAALAMAMLAAPSLSLAQRRPRRAPPPPPAAAPIVDLGPAHLIVPDGWSVAGPAAESAPVVLRRDDAAMIVSRQPVPNPQAWSSGTRDAHVDALVAGFTAGGAKELDRSVTTEAASQTPVLDLTLARGGRVVAVRVILFRTLTVAAAATADGEARETRALLERATRGLHPDR